jgi:hypothetical protein
LTPKKANTGQQRLIRVRLDSSSDTTRAKLEV